MPGAYPICPGDLARFRRASAKGRGLDSAKVPRDASTVPNTIARLMLRGAACLAFLALLSGVGLTGHVIEPGVEPLVRQLTRVPDAFPEGSTLDSAAIARDHVVVTYLLPDGGKAIFELRHPSVKPQGATVIGKVALTSSLPADHALTKAFVSQATPFLERFRWKRLTGADDPLAKARARLQMANLPDVKRFVDLAVEADDIDPAVRRDGAVLLKAAGHDADAKEQQAKAIELLGGAPGPADALVLAAMDGPPDEEAINALVEAEAGACQLVALVDALQLLKRPTEALKIADRVIAKDPACRRAHQLGAALTSLASDWNGLLSRVEEGLKRFPGDPDLTVRKATALRGLERYDEGRDVLEAVVRANPDDSGALSSLANLYTMTKTDKAVYEQLKAAFRKDPKDLVSGFLAGVLAHYLAEHKECVDIMHGLMERLPKQPRVPMYAAISAFFLGRQTDAEAYIARAAEIASVRDPDVYYCRSIIFQEKDREAAMKDLEHFLEVAELGWHSPGKVGRVRKELEMLRRGEIPPHAEAHHKKVEDPDAPPQAPDEPGLPPDQADAASDTEPVPEDRMPWWFMPVGIAAAALVLALFGLIRRRRGA